MQNQKTNHREFNLMNLIQNKAQEVYSTVKILSDIIYKLCKYSQYLLISLFYFLLVSLSYMYIDILFSLQKLPTETIVRLLIGFWTMFNMVFNYTMCVLVKPGNPQDLQYHEISSIEERCRKCYIIKPPRTHHCSMCNSCILQMDRTFLFQKDHCPWIGQCIGHHNRSYFMNFLVYTEIGLILLYRLLRQYMLLPAFWKDVELQKVSQMLTMEVYYFIATLIVVLGLFNLFHWYLVFTGKTTLECCLSDPRYTPNKKMLHNVKIVFGTLNPIVIFLPKFTVLKHKGYEWDKTESSQNTSMIEIEHNDLQKVSQKQMIVKK